MDRIIAGRFGTKTEADAAARKGLGHVKASDQCIFHNNPPGQHDSANQDEPPVPEHEALNAGKDSLNTAVAAGLTAGAIGMVGGPLVAVAMGGVAAYAGSLYGALQGMDNDLPDTKLPRQRPAGVILAVRISDPSDESNVIAALRSGGAVDVEIADGTWADGDWVDFDALASPRAAPPALPNASGD